MNRLFKTLACFLIAVIMVTAFVPVSAENFDNVQNIQSKQAVETAATSEMSLKQSLKPMADALFRQTA